MFSRVRNLVHILVYLFSCLKRRCSEINIKNIDQYRMTLVNNSNVDFDSGFEVNQ